MYLIRKNMYILYTYGLKFAGINSRRGNEDLSFVILLTYYCILFIYLEPMQKGTHIMATNSSHSSEPMS